MVLLLLLAVPHRTRSQSATPTAQTLAPRILYTQVFKHIVFLDYQADQADLKGQDGNKLRNYYQARVGLTATEAALLKSTAHDAVTAVRAIDQQINTEVVIFRQQFSLGRPANAPLPQVPPELLALQTAKDNAILSQVAALQTGFGAGRFQILDKYVRAAIAPHIAVTNVKIPAAPPVGSLPPLSPVPWQ
jgi:hypothetical protein